MLRSRTPAQQRQWRACLAKQRAARETRRAINDIWNCASYSKDSIPLGRTDYEESAAMLRDACVDRRLL